MSSRVGLLLVVLIAPTLALAADVERGRALYSVCSSCHGRDGEGTSALEAPLLAAQSATYLARQLSNFRDGSRAQTRGELAGTRMRAASSILGSSADVDDVAAFLASLAPRSSTETALGDGVRGQAFFAVCSGCHGPRGEGNPALNAPKLAGQLPSYLERQLLAFRAGTRGAAATDTFGAQMAAMAKTLADDQAVRDVSAFIAKLPASP